MNAFSLIALIFGTILAVLGFLTPVVKINSFEMGIIGGADAPTYLTLLFGDYDGLLIAVALLGVALLVTALACMLFEKSVGTHCSLSTSALSLGLSALVALGMVCFMVWLSIVSFGDKEIYPIEYPVSLGLGFICLAAFVVLFILYCKYRKQRPSHKGIALDVCTAFLYLPAFFFNLTFVYEAIG